MLTKAQIETYKQDGFVVVSQVISSDKIQAMKTELDKWIEIKAHNEGKLRQVLAFMPKEKEVKKDGK